MAPALPQFRPLRALAGRASVSLLALNSLEQSQQFPVGDGLVEGLLLEAAVMEVMLDDSLAQGLARQLRPLELGECLPQRLGHLAELRVLVGIAVVKLGRLELLVDAVETRGDGRGEGQVRVGVGSRAAGFHAEAVPLSAEAEATGAVVPARRATGAREGARLVTL